MAFGSGAKIEVINSTLDVISKNRNDGSHSLSMVQLFPLGITAYKSEIVKMKRSQTSGSTIKIYIKGQFNTGKIIKNTM